jgi:hypothetical protein
MQNMDFIEHIPRPKTRKKITFYSVVNVVLIPSAKDMESSMINEIWWSKTDYISFYASARKELKDFMEEHSSPLNRVQAMIILYQPSTMDQDPTSINCSAQI